MKESEEARKARLAEALRQNLRRRKAQEREMEGDAKVVGRTSDRN